MRSDIVPGAVFPDYALSDHRGVHRKLSELQQADPLVLVLSRGGFCPKWDIGSASQRTAWAKGDKAQFYPYGKTQIQVFAGGD